VLAVIRALRSVLVNYHSTNNPFHNTMTVKAVNTIIFIIETIFFFL